MLAQIGVNRFSFYYSNLGTTPSSTPGTSVVPGASNVEGSWTQVADDADIIQDIYLVIIWVSDGSVASQIKDHLLDIGVDPAGGTSFSAIISNIVCGESEAIDNGGGLFFQFPIFIKAGSSVAVRVQGANGTAGTVLVAANFYGQPSRPELIRVGQYSETIGTITNTTGVAFTPGTSGAAGAWASLGTTTRALWWWQLGVQCSDNTMTALTYHFDLAYGDGSNKHIIIERLRLRTTGSEAIRSNPGAFIPACFTNVPAGGELFIRGTCSGTPDSSWNAVAVGIGG